MDLSFNKIEQVLMTENDYPIDNQDIYMINLDLTGNPIKCDCSATYLKQAIDGKLPNRYFHLISDTLDCQPGHSLSLQNINYQDLNCPLEDVYPEQDCSKYGCKCVLNKYFKEVTINCSSANLEKFPMEVIQLPDDDFFINLDISDNSIRDRDENG